MCVSGYFGFSSRISAEEKKKRIVCLIHAYRDEGDVRLRMRSRLTRGGGEVLHIWIEIER